MCGLFVLMCFIAGGLFISGAFALLKVRLAAPSLCQPVTERSGRGHLLPCITLCTMIGCQLFGSRTCPSSDSGGQLNVCQCLCMQRLRTAFRSDLGCRSRVITSPIVTHSECHSITDIGSWRVFDATEEGQHLQCFFWCCCTSCVGLQGFIKCLWHLPGLKHLG